GWVLGKYTGLGGESSVLGFPTSDEVAVPGGVSQSFQGGMVFSSAATGAHEVHGWVLDKWTAMGGVSGALGFPTSDEVRTADGVYNTFVGGAVFSTPSTGAHEVHGWIGARWLALGAGSAAVGFPVSDELPVGDGVGVYNQFSNGVVVSSPSTGAHDVRGALAVKWSALGGAGSFLGYPTADQRSAPGGGQVAAFSGGSVYWSSGTGAFEVHGWIRDRWLANGGPGGGLGYPTSDEQPAPGGVGVFQTFANGLVFSSPSTGAREVRGLIEDEYTALGGLASSVGVPVTDELTMPDGFGRASVFSSGAAIYYSPASGAWQVRGWIRGTWSATNAEAGFLGYPLGDEESAGVPGAVLQRFQGGRVYSSGATGAREVHGSILARYLQLGGPASSLGLPVSNEYRSGNVARSDFQRGSITCNLTTGAITVTTS
ncbi:LGFP repeat-containing protein, partial [Klenkia brasiliensis]